MKKYIELDGVTIKVIDGILKKFKDSCIDEIKIKKNKSLEKLPLLGIGKIIGSFYFVDLNLLKNWLEFTSYYLKIETRADRIEFGLNDKSSLIKVKGNLVYLNSLKDKPLLLNKKSINLDIGFLSVNYNEINSIDNDGIIVVENFESFQKIKLHKLDFILKNPLFIYRGDGGDNNNVKLLIDKFNKDVYYFGDYDFYGLLIATEYKNFKDIIIPRENIKDLFINYGDNNKFYLNLNRKNITESKLMTENMKLIFKIICETKKCLMQEILLNIN